MSIGCGGSHGGSASVSSSAATGLPAPIPPGAAFGLTEDDAALLWDPGSRSPPLGAGAAGASIRRARAQLNALHPSYIRLLVDWAALQPDPARPAELEARVSGCARDVGPCVGYAGIDEQLAAIASRQHAARLAGIPAPEVVIQILGTPAWAARAPSGCEPRGTTFFSRPVSEAALGAYRALIGSLLALGAREGVALPWWSPWNEPNDPVFISPQRASCAASSPSLSPAVYSELARAMAAELHAAGGAHQMLLGELNAFRSDSPDRTSIQSFIAALPTDVICLGDVFSIHVYARSHGASGVDPVQSLESALDARGSCGRAARIWVTEAGAGAPHPGSPRPPGAADEEDGCHALAGQLIRWYSDPRVGAVFQYTFREDPAFPVGLESADLSHTYPAYQLWLTYSHRLAAGEPPPSPASGCA
jgi:hypothetical protein